jgi:hypothetical protein
MQPITHEMLIGSLLMFIRAVNFRDSRLPFFGLQCSCAAGFTRAPCGGASAIAPPREEIG